MSRHKSRRSSSTFSRTLSRTTTVSTAGSPALSRAVSRTSEKAASPPALPDKAGLSPKSEKTSFFDDATRIGRKESRNGDGASMAVVEARPQGALIRLEFEFKSKLFAGEAAGLVTVLQEECGRKLGGKG